MILKDAFPDPLSNIIEFTGKKREPSLQTVRSGYKACRHPQVFVNEEKRTVSCRDCETLLDAFEVLWEMAVKERRWLDDRPPADSPGGSPA